MMYQVIRPAIQYSCFFPILIGRGRMGEGTPGRAAGLWTGKWRIWPDRRPWCRRHRRDARRRRVAWHWFKIIPGRTNNSNVGFFLRKKNVFPDVLLQFPATPFPTFGRYIFFLNSVFRDSGRFLLLLLLLVTQIRYVNGRRFRTGLETS